MSFDPSSAEVFRYEDVAIDPTRHQVVCRYRLDGWTFEEHVVFPAGGDWEAPRVEAAARLLFLLGGVSYFKTAAPPVLDLGGHALTEAEEALLRAFYIDGLGEYAYRNGLDLSGLEIRADRRPPPPEPAWRAPAGRPLIPFGGGIDSVVTVEEIRSRSIDPALFVVSMGAERFAAIEESAAVTGLPVVRAERVLDPKVREAARLGMNFLNGHVPVTGVISAIAILAAALGDRDAVVMSNERSASSGNIEIDGRSVNHQFSKSWAFEQALRRVLTETAGPGFDWFSLLRPCSELWVAERMARLTGYLRVFRSCNRAFAIDPTRRLEHWCGVCDKCAFIDLILAPFLPVSTLDVIFKGGEPLANPALVPTFRTLLGVSPDAKPFECVGDVEECRVALLLAAARPDRAGAPVLRQLADKVRVAEPALADLTSPDHPAAAALLRPSGPHAIPERYAPGARVG
jgi:UDP-N-acetyl-alpha-D-muramoyl-L-alanyl-L-glutamate epimerase